IMGCGRLFEGSAAQMWNSLGKLKALPPDTRIFCAHEYTQNNARFALSVEPGNEDLRARAQRVDEMRARNIATVPGTLAEELLTNPFLRADVRSLQETAGHVGDPVATLAEIRHDEIAFCRRLAVRSQGGGGVARNRIERAHRARLDLGLAGKAERGGGAREPADQSAVADHRRRRGALRFGGDLRISRHAA